MGIFFCYAIILFMRQKNAFLLISLLIFSFFLWNLEVVAGSYELTEEENYIKIPPNVMTAEEKELVLSNLFEAEISDITYAIKIGLVTCEEVTSFFIERIETYNGTYNCFISLMTDSALERAKELDARLLKGEDEGLLFGVPVVIKDNIDIKGMYTTNGLSWEDSYIAEENADIVNKLLDQGAVILGKTNMSIEAEKAKYSYSLTAGMTYNAYNTELSAGGSSGGSAAATSLNLCVIGIGTDTNSSLRIPAAFNGCVALRFTTGKLDRTGIVKLNGYRDVPGAITRTVKDTAVMADILTGFEYDYSGNLDENSLKGARIGVLQELVNRSYSDEECVEAFNRALSELESLGAELVEVSLPRLFDYSEATEGDEGFKTYSKRYLEAYYKMLDENDVIAVVFPTYLSKPLSSEIKNGVFKADSQSFINNARPFAPAMGVPEITVQIGNHSLGAGIGMEIAARQNEENMLLNLAYAYTNTYDHRSLPSGAPNLHQAENPATMEEIYALVYNRLVREREEAEAEYLSAKETETVLLMQEESINALNEIETVLHEAANANTDLEASDTKSDYSGEIIAGSATLVLCILVVLYFLLKRKRL